MLLHKIKPELGASILGNVDPKKKEYKHIALKALSSKDYVMDLTINEVVALNSFCESGELTYGLLYIYELFENEEDNRTKLDSRGNGIGNPQECDERTEGDKTK